MRIRSCIIDNLIIPIIGIIGAIILTASILLFVGTFSLIEQDGFTLLNILRLIPCSAIILVVVFLAGIPTSIRLFRS